MGVYKYGSRFNVRNRDRREVLFVGLTLSITMNSQFVPKYKTQLIGFLLSLSITVGAIIGALVGRILVKSVAYGGIMGFAVVALSWLTIEELLKESHEPEESEEDQVICEKKLELDTNMKVG